MRVLWLVRRNFREHPGGDTIQILSTADALRRRGVNIELASDGSRELASFDLVHLFHLDRLWENLEHCRRARAADKPIVLSTIYWPPDEFDRGGRTGFQGFLARTLGSRSYESLRIAQRRLLHAWERHRTRAFLPSSLRACLRGFGSAARELLESSAVLLPNSRAEQEAIENRFDIRRPAVIVPNAADSTLFGPPPAPAPPRAGVLCVGRVEPRKNQLALIRALSGTGVPLTLVGDAGRFNRGYYARCRRAANDRVRFVPTQPAEELRQYYHAAQVHACVSWYETPGLVNLEAALCGCALLATPGGCTREYLGDDAVYCQPNDPASIRSAVTAALSRGASPRLAERISRAYTWDRAAEMTHEAYALALRA